jgi:hypothetical protein
MEGYLLARLINPSLPMPLPTSTLYPTKGVTIGLHRRAAGVDRSR